MNYLICLIAVAMACMGLAGVFLGQRVALAQGADNDYVDVGLMLEYSNPGSTTVARDVKVFVMNHGARTAYDVKVVVDVVYPKNSSHWSVLPEVPVGSASLEDSDYSFQWDIPVLEGLHSEEVTVRVKSFRLAPNDFDKQLDPHEFFGEVTTASFESALHKGNNTDRIWFDVISDNVKTSRQSKGSYFISSVSVDNPNPSPGSIVNFTISAAMDVNINSEIAIKLTDGLAVDIDAGASPKREISYDKDPTGSDDPDYSNGVFTIGTRKFGEALSHLSATVPVRVASNAVVNKQCLTATITGNPPAGVGPFNDDISNNVAKLCLGLPEPYFTSADLQEFVSHPCVGNTDPPCDNTNDVKVRALDATIDPPEALAPGTPLIHVPDTSGDSGTRKYDSGANSVNGGDKVSWQATVQYSYRQYTSEHERWIDVSDSFSYEMPGKDSNFDKLHIYTTWAQALLNDEQRNAQFLTTYNPGSNPSANGPFDLTAEFEKLGTYKVSFTVTAKHDNNTPSDTNDDVSYTATGAYTFHLGPIGDLAVEDGGASSSFAPNRSLLSVIAINNDTTHANDVQVRGLPMGAEVIYKSQGTYDGSTGVWDVGELKFRDYLRSRGEADPTLVLSASAGAEHKVTIAEKNYEVCVGPMSNPQDLAHTTQAACEAVTDASWNSTPVYDYKPDDNTATIRATGGGGSGARGAGAGGPMAPRFANTPVLSWEAVPHVNDWPVHRYQVQYLNGDNWLDLAEVASSQTHFADLASGSGRAYRVRALNEAGVPGFWSRSASRVSYRQASPPLNVSAVAGQPGEVVVSWDGSSDDGGSTITYYQVQWSRSGSGGWSNACRTSNASQLTCTNTGIPSGETRYYRVAAYAGGLGAWSDHAVATTVAGVPEAPRLNSSDATSGSGENIFRAIRLTWKEPRDHGSSIYAYEIQYAEYDTAARACGTDWQYLDSVGGQYSGAPPREYTDNNNHNGLWPGITRCYRVSAINSAGHGAWSNVVQQSTGAVPPEWVYLDGEADGQNAITLYWDEPYHDGGAPISGYQLQYSDDGADWRSLTSPSASARTYTHTGRNVGETWRYRIRARNSAGWGEWSDPAISVTIEPGATADIAQPTLTVRATTATEILLSWTSLCDPNREGDCAAKGVDGYYVEHSEDGGLYGWDRLTWLWNDQTGWVDSSVEPGATRYYRVAGYEEVNGRDLFGRWSQVKNATTADFRVGAPQDFTIVAEGERGLRLEWDEVTEGRDASSITGYRIERTTEGGDDMTWAARQTNRNSGPYVETGLTPDTYYCYRVAAVTRNGSVPWIGPYSFECASTPAPGG